MSYIKQSEVEMLINYIEQYETIIIHRHIRPDPDAIGSQLGLKALIENKYPNKRVLAAGTMSKGLAWIGEMDRVTRADYDDALVIVTDTANTERIDGKHYHQGKALIKIDHHIDVDQYADEQIVHTEASSTCELLTQLTKVAGDLLPLTAQAAQYFYIGLLGDTGRFMHALTPLTMESAALMLQTGIDARDITNQFSEKAIEEVQFQGVVLDQMQIYPEGVVTFTVTRDMLEKYQVTEEQASLTVSLPAQIEGIKAWVWFIEQENHQPKYRVRLRSKGPIVNELANEYNGGGHALASGADAQNEEEKEAILSKLRELAKNYQK